jgi:hypothetical protein
MFDLQTQKKFGREQLEFITYDCVAVQQGVAINASRSVLPQILRFVAQNNNRS